MKVHRVVVILLLSLVYQRTTSQRLIGIIWDRHWLDQNITGLTLNVNLGDQFVFLCQVNPDTEDAEDVFESLVRLQVDRCNATREEVTFIDACTDDGFDITIPVTNTPDLVNRLSFEVGQVYYFTSFSDGTRQSAENREILEGGGCSRQPPLRLTVSVVQPSSSVMISSTALSSFVTTTTMTSSSSSMVVTTHTPTTTSGTTTTPSSSSTPDQGGIGGAAGHLMPLNYFIILLIAIVSLILFN